MSTPIPNRWHHLHLAAPDPAAAADWYADQLGAERRTVGPYELALFGRGREGHFFTWYQADAAERSEGSALDHFGWSVPDLEQTMAKMVEAGATALDGPRTVGPAELKISFLEDPWGAKIELLEDADHLGFHHVHVVVPEPDAERDWWADRFGGERGKYQGLVSGLGYERHWMLFRQSQGDSAATAGRAIDHVGLRVENLDAVADDLTARGDTLEAAPADFGENRFAFLSSPSGVRIELFQVGG